MNSLIEAIFGTAFIAAWLAGIVLAKGFWLTLLAACFPPYSLYLIIERVMVISGVLP